MRDVVRAGRTLSDGLAFNLRACARIVGACGLLTVFFVATAAITIVAAVKGSIDG